MSRDILNPAPVHRAKRDRRAESAKRADRAAVAEARAYRAPKTLADRGKSIGWDVRPERQAVPGSLTVAKESRGKGSRPERPRGAINSDAHPSYRHGTAVHGNRHVVGRNAY